MTIRAHVVGAGLAGLAAAVALVRAGAMVTLSEAAARAGGRCRSYHDPRLGQVIDNGNHLVLAGNIAVAAFRAEVGAVAPLAGPEHAEFAFMDLASDARWTLRLNDGPLPWWVLDARRRVPGTSVADYLGLARLLLPHRGRTIGAMLTPGGMVWERLLAPVLLAVLNTDPAHASARLAGNVLRESLAKGGRASAPRLATPSLAAAFIDPAVAWLAAKGVDLATGRRLTGLNFTEDRVSALVWGASIVPVAPDEAVILAVPAWEASALVPGLVVPDQHASILNAHYRMRPPLGAPRLLGLIGGTAEWVFTHDAHISVTVSAADRLIERPRAELAARLWGDVARALRLAEAPMPPWQIVKEKRATFAATPAQDALRPPTRTHWHNLFLAGDWVQTGLPATIEGALRAGDTAALLALGARPRYRLAA